MAELSRCLVPVRPVGMSDDAATEWLLVLYADVCHLPESLLIAACAEARSKCTRHGEILPAILNSDVVQWSDCMERSAARALAPHQPPPRLSESGEVASLISDTARALKA